MVFRRVAGGEGAGKHFPVVRDSLEVAPGKRTCFLPRDATQKTRWGKNERF